MVTIRDDCSIVPVPLPFVGRERELAVLAGLRKASTRAPRFVLVGGEAGIGKSRLIAEFLHGRQRPNAFGTAECSAVAPAPFAPFIGMLKTMAPAAAQRLSVAPTAMAHGEGAARAVFDDVRTALEQVGAKRVVLLCIEDLHLADSASLALLAHLAHASRHPRLFVVATYRSEPLEQTDEFVATLARLMRLPNVASLDVPPLLRRDARTITAAAIGDERATGGRLIDALVERADGNAFFLEELIKHAAEQRDTAVAPLPSSITAVIRARLAALPASDRAVLLHAAVFGRSFDVELMPALAGVDRDVLWATLRRARDAGLIVDEPSDERRLRFRHALTREAIAGELLGPERQPLHARILGVLEALPDGERDAYRTDLAYHASESRDAGKAVRYGEAAGDHAVGVHAYADAHHHYEIALHATGLSTATRRRLLRKLADSLHWNRSAQGARQAYREAFDLAVAAGDRDDSGDLALCLARLHYVHGNTAEAIAMARTAVEALSDGGSAALRDVAAARLALYHLFLLDTDQAWRALAMIERPDARDVAPLFRQIRAGALAVDCDAAWRDEASLYLAAAERVSDAEFAMARHNVADCAVATGEMRLAEEQLRRALAADRPSDFVPYHVFTLGALAYHQYLAGGLSESRRLAEAALAAGGWAMSDATSNATAIWVGLALGDDAFADAAYDEELVEVALASRQSQNIGNVAGAAADLLAERGRLADARRLIHRALERIEHPYLCETFLFVAARVGAESDLDRVVRVAAHERRPRDNALCAGTIAMVGALVDRRRGGARVSAAANEAAERLMSIGWRTLAAEALELAGRQAEAAELYRDIGHVRGLRRIAARQARVTHGREAASTALLSRREREIALLVADGKTNRAIADALGIAAKTVEQHLSSAFSKLQLSSRTQLATALMRDGAQTQERAT